MEQNKLPERVFAVGEEPSGDRVNTYHKPKRIESIIDALDQEEVEFLRHTTFGKIISQAENPSFSGSFGQFALVRILRVNKKYEIWFLFAGQPLRMSLHEFAHVTGLNCRKIPKKSSKRKKNPIMEKLYWGELFGSLKFCLVDTAIEMLKKKKIKDKQMRLKYACLAFTASVLLPTSHFPRIIPEHVEMIRDLEEFLKYPWGRVTFELLVTGIKKKDEISLSQASFALPGFVDAIQLVFIAAVPQIRETVNPPEPVVVIDSDSESESDEDESLGDQPVVDKASSDTPVTVRYCVNPAHVRDLDDECKVDVISMVVDTTHTEEELLWEDEVNDEAVDNLVRLIQQGHRFNKSMFVGGLSAVVLARMRAERKQKEKEAKDKKERDNHLDSAEGDIGDAYDPTHVANLVGGIVTQQIDDAVYKLGDNLEERLAKLIKAELSNMEAAVIKSILGHLDNYKPNGSADKDNTGVVLEGGKTSGDCTFSGPSLPPVIITRGEGQNATTAEPTDSQTVIPQQQGDPSVAQQQAASVINMVISDIQGLTEQNQVFPLADTTHSSSSGSINVEENTNSVSYVADTPMDTNFSTPAEQKTNFTHHHLSPVPEEEKNNENEIEFLLTLIEIPTFSLGLSQEEVPPTELIGGTVPVSEAIEDIGETRKSRRTRIPPPLFNDYQCDPKMKTFRAEQPPQNSADNIDEIYMSMRDSAGQNKVLNVGNGISIRSEELNDVVDRTLQMAPKVMDVLMYYISLELNRKRSNSSKVAIHDTNFPALLMKQHARLVKCAVKDRSRLKYDADLLKYFMATPNSADFYERIYFPFCIDKQHWIGVCLHLPGSTVQVLDCNYGFRTDGMMKKDLNPITIVVPHILNTVLGNLGANQRKPYQIVRVEGVPQNHISTDAAATTALLIQSHALNDGGGSLEITKESLSAGTKHLAVLVYRDVTPV